MIGTADGKTREEERQGMKKCGKAVRLILSACVVLLTLLPCTAGLAGESIPAEIANRWAEVKDVPIPVEKERQNFRLLRLVMEGYFADEPEDALAGRILVAALPLLAGIPEGDIPAFAQAYRLPDALVRQAWWLSMKSTLRASVRAEAENPQNPFGSIPGQWLDEEHSNGDNSPSTPGILMDEESLRSIAREYGLPYDFIRFLAGAEETEANGPGRKPTTSGTSMPTPPSPKPNAETAPETDPAGSQDGNGTQTGGGEHTNQPQNGPDNGTDPKKGH